MRGLVLFRIFTDSLLNVLADIYIIIDKQVVEFGSFTTRIVLILIVSAIGLYTNSDDLYT